ncbi:MAG: hypothetical protein M0Z58_03910 [Nitrospiraceae bacterium]|nr:hypothetical protein [Nitrospiraceae bacterium]
MNSAAKKKIAVLVRERTDEALRMALGLTLCDDALDVYLTGAAPAGSEQNRMSIDMLRTMGAGLYSLFETGDFTLVSERDMPRALLDYDIVIAY